MAPPKATTDKAANPNEKLHLLYLIWASVGCPSQDNKFLASHLGISENAASKRVTRLKKELIKAGLPEPAAAGNAGGHGRKEAGGKKGKRVLDDEQDDEDESAQHTAEKFGTKKVKIEEDD